MWITELTQDAIADAVDALVNTGSGTAAAKFETSGDVEVATCPMSDPAFGSSDAGVITADTITDDEDATGGTIAQLSIYNKDAAKVCEFSVAVSGSDVDISSVTISEGDTVGITELTITCPSGA